MKRRMLLSALFMSLVLAGPLQASAQHGYRVTKRLAFKKGHISTAVRGAIPNPLEGHEFIVRARQGQTMSIKLASSKKAVVLSVWAPNGEMIGEETALRQWSGELPETGDYRIVINTVTGGVARYRLEVQIAADI